MSFSIRKAADAVFPNPSYQGWGVVGACLLCAALSAPGQSFALALYMEPIAGELKTSRVDVAAVYAWATLAAAAVLPLAGRVADRSSSRFYLGAVIGLMGLSMLLLSTVSSLSLLAVAFFALRLLGQGAIGLGVLTLNVERLAFDHGQLHDGTARSAGAVGSRRLIALNSGTGCGCRVQACKRSPVLWPRSCETKTV
jgi:predicted MFS family arabinose efflux permease